MARVEVNTSGYPPKIEQSSANTPQRMVSQLLLVISNRMDVSQTNNCKELPQLVSQSSRKRYGSRQSPTVTLSFRRPTVYECFFPIVVLTVHSLANRRVPNIFTHVITTNAAGKGEGYTRHFRNTQARVSCISLIIAN